ncbi:MAG TPA: UvrD-helicase domain-containing protein [Candidatus Corynebacterium gallistercoris]|uniref:DNA 3'-5' helicase n=1 Tax=Candidatus Corynebacterium gallistercoris TaxID=2838530 RepID=A0A9D1RX96_9CORY|nr:UvrD-helicase domain-containing protein [Candidatus Corynebacterium gallistercoris]
MSNNTRPYAAPGSPVISPEELSRLLGQRFAPTAQQAAVIGAEGHGAFLVVAGAGAGKTETMAARVVWLVANGFVLPEQVLGLTFTRKAAAELGERVRARLDALARSSFMDQLAADDPRRDALNNIAPTVSTYDSYAGAVVREYGLLLPAEPTARIVGEAEQWMIARDVVRTWPDLLTGEVSQASLIEMVQKLSEEMDSHLASLEAVEDTTRAAIANLENLEPGPRVRSGDGMSKDNRVFLTAQLSRLDLLDLVKAYRRTLQEKNLQTFGQQMSMAAQLVQAHPQVGQEQRRRFRVVLLDEYQDTGHAQRVLLRGLYGSGQDDGLSVTAVGDPMQSIYMFRGATASNLENFRTDFPTAAGMPAEKLQLTTSWRNPSVVLDLANEVSGWSMDTGRLVEPLEPRPDAPDGDVSLAFFDEEQQEVQWLAQKLADHWQEYQRQLEMAIDPSQVHPFSAAVLVRKNRQAIPIYNKLQELGVPADMTAGPGLLDIPEVADVYATLRILVDPSDDAALLRLLMGPRWNLGAADLAVLGRRARQIANRGHADDDQGYPEPHDDVNEMDRWLQRRAERIEDLGLTGYPSELVDKALEVIPDDAQVPVGLADALADFTDAEAQGMSAWGAQRIRELSQELGYLRRHSMSKPLPDLVADIEHMMGVRTEVLTRWHKDQNSSVGTSHLDRFATIVREFSELSSASPSALVEYLRTAHQQEDGLEPGEVIRRENTVQILTVHKAKGLEWDIVAVPHASRNNFGDQVEARAESTWATAAQVLPTDLRGDAQGNESPSSTDRPSAMPARPAMPATMPVLDTTDADNRAAHNNSVAKFKKQVAQVRAKEDDRVFYVAITRTERVLLISGSAFDQGVKGRDPAVMLVLLRNYLELMRGGEGIVTWSPLGKVYGDNAYKSEDEPPRETVLMLPPVEVNRLRMEAEEARKNAEKAEPIRATWPAASPVAGDPGSQEGADMVRHYMASGDAVFGGDATSASPADPGTQAHSWDVETELLIGEFQDQAKAHVTVPMDVRMTATEAVAVRRDAAEYARRKRRPVPLQPKPFAKRGTAFHNWLEDRYNQVSLLDEDQLPGAADATYDDPQLERLKAAFLESEWADRQPASVEGAYSVVLGNHVFEGRIDAVFHFSSGPTEGWMIVDWKTGKKPVGQEMKAAEMQLAVYRLAWAKVLSQKLGVEVPVDNVRAAFHYVAFNETFEPRTLPTAEELDQLWNVDPQR